MVAQEEVGTGPALGTAGAEEVVAAGVEVVAAGVVEWGQVVGTLLGVHLGRGGRMAGWETAPSAPASARCGKQVG